MPVERSRRSLVLFRRAVELDPSQRAGFLERTCAGDRELREEIEALLAAGAGSPSFLERPPRVSAGASHGRDPLVGTRLGHYHLTRVISSGGMGTVYEAVQEHPRRTVAVKVLRPGIASPSTLRRFEYESQLMGRLRHPGIAQIFEACIHGEADGVPYFVMEYVPNARTLLEYAHQLKLDAPARLALFMEVCEAVHHGHQKGIIHRDLKPSNILVDSAGQVKVIDFGVARATDSDLALTTLQTQVGSLIGTLQYMSPEQCDADPHDLDTRSDVYALGVVLYELLCARPPYDVRDQPVYEAVRRIREEQPARPSTSVRTLRGDLETILLKALEKDRSRRYQSADELRRDIGRYLEGRPIAARPPSAFYHLRSFTRRNKVLVGGVVAVFAVLVAGIVVSTMLLAQAEAEAESARQINRFFNEMLAAVDPLRLPIGSPLAAAVDPSAVPAGGFARDVSVVEMARLAAPRIADSFADKPLLEALARETIGMTIFGLGQYAEARLQLKTALALRAEHLGPDHPDTLRSMVQLGNLLRERAEASSAADLLRPALEGMRRVHGEEHRHTLVCSSILAGALVQTDDFERGFQLFERTLEAQRRTRGPTDRDTLWTMTEYSFGLATRLRVRKATELVEEACEISGRTLGAEDFVTVFAESCMGFMHNWRGEFERGEELLRRSLEKRRQILGDEHPRTCLVKAGLAESLHGEAALAERTQLKREALEGARSVLAADHFWRVNFFFRQRMLLGNHGMYDELEQALRNRYTSCREELGEDSPMAADALAHLTVLLLESGRAHEAEDLLRAGVDSARARLGHAAPQTLRALGGLASFQLRSGRPEVGAGSWREWLQAVSAAGGDEQIAVLQSMALAAAELHGAGRSVEAREFVHRAVAGWRLRCERPAADAHDFNGLAWLLLTCDPPDLRDPPAALPLAERALALCSDEDAFVLDTLATACFENGRCARAVELQRRALAAPTVMTDEQREAMKDTLIRFLLRCGEPEAAERLLDERMDELRERLGEDAIFLPDYQFRDAELLAAEGRFDLAAPRAEACLAGTIRAEGGDPTWKVAAARALHGRCLAGSGRFDEGLRVLLEGYADLERNPLVEAVQARAQASQWIAELREARDAAGVTPPVLDRDRH